MDLENNIGPGSEGSEGTVVPGLEAEGEAVVQPPAEAGEGEVTYEDLAKKKKWNDTNAAAKSYSSLESEYGRLKDDHAKIKEFANEAYNALIALQKEKDIEKAGKKGNGEEGPTEKLQELIDSNPEVAEMVKGMLGTELKPLKATLDKAQLSTALMEMKQDKEHFPHLDKALEAKMDTIFRTAKTLPPTRETLYLLYQAAVGLSVSEISAKAKDQGIKEAYNSIDQKRESFSEGGSGTQGGKASTEDDKLIDSIINAGGGTQI